MASGLQNNTPNSYCDDCDTHLIQVSPSARKTHCSGRKHNENVKERRQAQSLIDRTTAGFQQGEMLPTPSSASSPTGHGSLSLLGPPRPGVRPTHHPRGPSLMPMMDPPPPLEMMPGGPAPGTPMAGHMPRVPGPPVMRPPARPRMVRTRPGMRSPFCPFILVVRLQEIMVL